MKRLRIALVLASLAPTIALAAADAGVDAAPAPSRSAAPRDMPDPPPLSSREAWVFDLRYARGDVFLLATRPLTRSAPEATPRSMGRFAIELFDGAELIERVRFDFPLLGAPDVDSGHDPLGDKLRSRIGVVFPRVARGTRLELHDRASGQRWTLPWPPKPLADAATDAPNDATPEKD